jgi:hypothetical protein
MNLTQHWIAVVAVAGVVAASDAGLAWDREAAQERRAHRQKVDANADGNITAAEAATAAKATVPQLKARFQALDTNKDGVLTASEVPDEATFKKLDKNGDGKVTEPEFLAVAADAAVKLFQSTDKNRDGTITTDEAIKSMQEKAKK